VGGEFWRGGVEGGGNGGDVGGGGGGEELFEARRSHLVMLVGHKLVIPSKGANSLLENC